MESITGFALIARKLQTLQKIAPFQERAIELFLRCLELGTTYQERNEFYDKASASITGISFSVGETYADVVSIARDAPIPEGFDDYERFVYKTKLLKQIEGYEDQALENYLKTIKIEDAYKLKDSTVTLAKERIAGLLFNRGRCYDLLCTNAFTRPPFPAGVDEAQKEEYIVRFEEIGLRFQEQAFDIYKNILNLAKQSYTSGEYVSHAYVRMYQNFPDEYGVKEMLKVEKTITSGSQWRVYADGTHLPSTTHHGQKHIALMSKQKRSLVFRKKHRSRCGSAMEIPTARKPTNRIQPSVSDERSPWMQCRIPRYFISPLRGE